MTTVFRRLRERVKRLVNRFFAAAGLELRRAPYAPAATLELTLAHLLAVEMAKGGEPVVVQVGANDGATGDPLFGLIHGEASMRGLLIEPQATAFERLARAYAEHPGITLLNVAIAAQDGPVELFAVDPDRRHELPRHLRDWVDQITSASRRHLELHLADHVARPGDWIKPLTVPGLTLSSALAEAGLRRFDALQIDVEGMDNIVLDQALDAGLRPRWIAFEHCHLSHSDRRQAWARLEELGYALNLEGTDTIASLEATIGG